MDVNGSLSTGLKEVRHLVLFLKSLPMHPIASKDILYLMLLLLHSLIFSSQKIPVNILCLPQRNTRPKPCLPAVPHEFHSRRLAEVGRLSSSPAPCHTQQNRHMTQVGQALKEFAKSVLLAAVPDGLHMSQHEEAVWSVRGQKSHITFGNKMEFKGPR